MAWPVIRATHTPIPAPIATVRRPDLSTRSRMLALGAPSAMRTPSSRVRWFTSYSTSPYVPAAAASSPRKPRLRNRIVASRHG